MSAQWEYKDFEWTDPALSSAYASGDVIGTFRNEWWSQARSEVMPEVQKWLDDGWEPVTPIGPDCWILEEKKIPIVSTWTWQWVIWLFGLIPTMGLALLFLFQTYTVYKPAGFRVQMRRRKV